MRTFNRSARLFLLSITITGIVFSAWMLFFNLFILARGFDKQFLGLLNAAPSIAALATGLPLGALSDRLGRKRSMVLGLAVTITAYALQVSLLSPPLIFLMGLVAGAGTTLWTVSQAPFIVQASSLENRTLLFSLNFGLSTMAGAVGNLFAGQLPQVFSRLLAVPDKSASAYQAVLLASVAISALALIPLLSLREPAQQDHREVDAFSPGFGSLLRQKLVWKLFLPNLLVGWGAALLIGYLNVFYVERFGLSDQVLGALFAGMALLIGVGSFIGPYLVRALDSKIRAVVFAEGLSIPFLLLIGFSPVLWLSQVGFLLRAMLMMMGSAIYPAFCMEKFSPHEQGRVNSVLTISWQIGWAVGPYLSGLIQKSYGFSPLFVLTGLFYTSAVVLMWLFFGRERSESIKDLARSPVRVGE